MENVISDSYAATCLHASSFTKAPISLFYFYRTYSCIKSQAEYPSSNRSMCLRNGHLHGKFLEGSLKRGLRSRSMGMAVHLRFAVNDPKSQYWGISPKNLFVSSSICICCICWKICYVIDGQLSGRWQVKGVYKRYCIIKKLPIICQEGTGACTSTS